MRFEGTLKTWNDDRGFGFIEPTHGGQEIFVHIKAFGHRDGRPQVQQLVSFEVEPAPDGRKRAKNVELLRVVVPRRTALKDSPAKWGGATLFAIPAFGSLFVLLAVLWKPPALLALSYVVTSLVTFCAYALDKRAARLGARRTPENTLHVLAFAGGWPGALLAQQFLRHKSAKQAFRKVFWATVVTNVLGLVLLCSPVGRALWATQG
jgi:uncharacterized membrane protein YsdA (DUF1294 family)/cold shock CspA family protein